MVEDGNEVIQELDDVCPLFFSHAKEPISYMRLRTKKRGILIVPRYSLLSVSTVGPLYSFAVLRDPNSSSIKLWHCCLNKQFA